MVDTFFHRYFLYYQPFKWLVHLAWTVYPYSWDVLKQQVVSLCLAEAPTSCGLFKRQFFLSFAALLTCPTLQNISSSQQNIYILNSWRVKCSFQLGIHFINVCVNISSTSDLIFCKTMQIYSHILCKHIHTINIRVSLVSLDWVQTEQGSLQGIQ